MKRKLFLIFLLINGFIYSQNALRINEIGHGRQKNDTKSNFMNRSWLELYNGGNVKISGHFYITNDTLLKQKWKVTGLFFDKLTVPKGQYSLIGIGGNYRLNFYSANDVQMSTKDTLYLVLDSTIITKKLWGSSDKKRSSGVSNLNDTLWSNNLIPTPKYNNFEYGTSRSRGKLLLNFSPVAFTEVKLHDDSEQKNKGIYSYRFGLAHNIVIAKIVEFQYGLSYSKIGYNAFYPKQTETSPFATRERTTEGTIRGHRTSFELKSGVYILPRCVVYFGFDIGGQPITTKLVSDIKITNFSTGETVSSTDVIESSTFETNYPLAGSIEFEYVLNKWASCNLTYHSAPDIAVDFTSSINSNQRMFALGLKISPWSGRRQIKKFSILKL